MARSKMGWVVMYEVANGGVKWKWFAQEGQAEDWMHSSGVFFPVMFRGHGVVHTMPSRSYNKALEARNG